MNKRFIICAFGISHPGSMGGNSKIALELIGKLSQSHPVVVVTSSDKFPTFSQNITLTDAITIHTVSPFVIKNPKTHPFQEGLYYTQKMSSILVDIGACDTDVLYSCSDFLLDVLPAFLLKPKFGFIWIPTLFLFVPFVFENILHHYRFPVLKYFVYFFYQQCILLLIKARGDLFVITNECDKKHFPQNMRSRAFAFYGGVNTEQIQEAIKTRVQNPQSKYDVVSCSRLHPQKGICSFLDIWKQVVSVLPDVRLAIIGNGTADYEDMLRKKADRLEISQTISWLGYVNNEAKYRIYLSSRLFIHPTIYDNNGMVAAEALCSGLPVVMYDLPNLRSIYTTGCVKVPEGDHVAFASAITRLIRDTKACLDVKPTPEQILSLQEQWAWCTRTDHFMKFLRLNLNAGAMNKQCKTS